MRSEHAKIKPQQTFPVYYNISFNTKKKSGTCSTYFAPEPSKIRTEVNDIKWLKDLHKTIKLTTSSYFKMLQDFVTNH